MAAESAGRRSGCGRTSDKAASKAAPVTPRVNQSDSQCVLLTHEDPAGRIGFTLRDMAYGAGAHAAAIALILRVISWARW